MVKTELHIDFETYSDAELKQVGAYSYAVHPSTGTICLALIYNREKIVLYPGVKLPPAWAARLKNPKIIKIAHNLLFDLLIYNHVYRREQSRLGVKLPELKLSDCYDNMATCYYYGLPGSLEKAAKILGHDQLKFAEGRKAMLYVSRLGLEKADRKTLGLIGRYCLGDVKIQKKIYDTLGPINDPLEMKVYNLSMEMNLRGIPIDLNGVRTILKALYWFNGNIDALILKLSNKKLTSADIRSAQKLTEYFRSFGVILPNCQEATLLKVRDKISKPHLKKLIDIRIKIAKSSVKKLLSMEKMAETNSNARAIGAVQYYGSHTGRYAGRGFQPLNLPRETMTDRELNQYFKTCRAVIKKPAPDISDLELIEEMPKTIRRLIKAGPGKILVWVDYAQIEARVVAWLAGEENLINDFLTSAPGVDVYTLFASKIYKRKITKKDKTERQVGKTGVLGLGFGMGYIRFSDQVDAMTDIKISHSQASEIVNIYRSTYPKIPGFWRVTDALFRKAVIEKPKKPFTLSLKFAGVTLAFGWSAKINGAFITLPSGRSLYYPGSEVTANGIKYLNPVTSTYAKLYGGLITENIVQAVARDIMTHAMLTIPGAIMPVHDEIVFEVENKKGIENTIVKQMIGPAIPSWFDRRLIGVEMKKGIRYDK